MTAKIDRWPARLDALQSLSGLLLLLFIWGHMFFESSILLGKDAMFFVSRLFEGELLFGEPYPQLVSFAVATIGLLIAAHALLALRKFPASYRQYSTLHRHLGTLHHSDTTLWYVQVVTGFAMFFLAPVHLYVMFVQPEKIGPYASADRVWTEGFWLLYVMLLVSVHLHAGVGFYRLIMKWGWFSADTSAVCRRRTKLAMWGIIAFYLSLGSASLVTYMKIGSEHADRAGERYIPAHYTPGKP
jgi:fumarate reductase subunit C